MLEKRTHFDLTKALWMWPPYLFIWCSAEVYETDNCRPLAGCSRITLAALRDFNSHYVLGMRTAGPNVLCVCLQAISSFCSDSFWHIKHALITEERRLCFSEGCICWKALTVAARARTITSFMSGNKKSVSWIDYHRGYMQTYEPVINICWRRMG